MSGTVRNFLAALPAKGRTWMLRIVLFLFGALVLSRGVEFALLKYYSSNWESISRDIEMGRLTRAIEAFNDVQRETRRIAVELAQHPTVLTALRDSIKTSSVLTDHVAAASMTNDMSFEVYDRDGELISWYGRSGPVHGREVHDALDGRLSLFVTDGPIYSEMFVTTPVRGEGRIIGVVLARRTVETNYPIRNRFLSHEVTSASFLFGGDPTVEFEFGSAINDSVHEHSSSLPIVSIDGTLIGKVYTLRPSLASAQEQIASTFYGINISLALLIGLLGISVVVRHLRKLQSPWVRIYLITLLIWGTRYLFIWFDIPNVLFKLDVFDPRFFASKFGAGLAKSIGDMTLSSLALSFNLFILGTAVARTVHSDGVRVGRILKLVLTLPAALFFFLLLRGYAAVVRSAVFDSTLRFNDPSVVVPTVEMGLMLFNLLLLGFGLVFLAGGIVFLLLERRETGKLRSGWTEILAMTMAIVLMAVLFGEVHPSPLTSLLFRLLFGFAAFGLAIVARRSFEMNRRFPWGRVLAVTALLSTLFFYPLLDEQVQSRDRGKVELFANDLLRPVDAWLKNVVDEGVSRFQSESVRRALLNNREESHQRLAFGVWSRSIASREGYSCLFVLIDEKGMELSKFAIGGQGLLSRLYREMTLPASERELTLQEVGAGVNAVKVYRGTTPIVHQNELLGYGIVFIAAAQQTLFRGDVHPLLRPTSAENIETFYRPIVVSEYSEGKLSSSSNQSMHAGRFLSEDAHTQLSKSASASLWIAEVMGGKNYETLYVRRPDGEDRVIGLSIEHLELLWHLFGIVKLIVYWSILFIGIFIVHHIARLFVGVQKKFAFRDKLLAAFVVTAVVPLVVIALYWKSYAADRLTESLSSRLKQETATLSATIMDRFGQVRAQEDASFVDYYTEQLATELGADFNVYVGRELRLSSRPELYDAGILDRRLNGVAYASIYQLGTRFHFQSENIGAFRYLVGYRPIIDGGGNTIGVVSVPTLYRQDVLDEDIARSNAFLFGIYSLVLVAIVLLATSLANRIASPIHRLTEATKRVAGGDLDVTVDEFRTEGEIGELMESFNLMTRDLKSQREALARAERELAWNEMAKQVAHEIKNPLTPMKLSIQHLQATYRDRSEDFSRVFADVSKTIVEQIDALSRIATEFSHFGRMPERNLSFCNVHEVMMETIHLFREESGVSFKASLEAHSPTIRADREELRRAFINIIRNAIQAMGGSGTIEIESRLAVGGMIELRIHDTGPGIPEDIRNKLFQPNFSTKTDGMGLGLAIVKKTVEDLNGDIQIESEVGNGTVVIIRLPAGVT